MTKTYTASTQNDHPDLTGMHLRTSDDGPEMMAFIGHHDGVVIAEALQAATGTGVHGWGEATQEWWTGIDPEALKGPDAEIPDVTKIEQFNASNRPANAVPMMVCYAKDQQSQPLTNDGLTDAALAGTEWMIGNCRVMNRVQRNHVLRRLATVALMKIAEDICCAGHTSDLLAEVADDVLRFKGMHDSRADGDPVATPTHPAPSAVH